MCAVTRAVLPESELIRFVAAPDGSVVADLKAKLPGRGVWVGAERKLVAEAVKRNVVPARPEAAADARRRPRRSGRGAAAGSGARAARAGPQGGRGRSPASPRSRPRSGASAWRRSSSPPTPPRTGNARSGRRFAAASADDSPLPVLRLFASEELGLALGRPNVIHAAVLQGPAGMKFRGSGHPPPALRGRGRWPGRNQGSRARRN